MYVRLIAVVIADRVEGDVRIGGPSSLVRETRRSLHFWRPIRPCSCSSTGKARFKAPAKVVPVF